MLPGGSGSAPSSWVGTTEAETPRWQRQRHHVTRMLLTQQFPTGLVNAHTILCGFAILSDRLSTLSDFTGGKSKLAGPNGGKIELAVPGMSLGNSASAAEDGHGLLCIRSMKFHCTAHPFRKIVIRRQLLARHTHPKYLPLK